MAQCRKCGKPIAWRKVSGKWVPHEPARDVATGEVAYTVQKNGGGRTVKRASASEVRHVCPDGISLPVTASDGYEWTPPITSAPPKPKPPKPEPEPEQTGPWERVSPTLWKRGSQTRDAPRIPRPAADAWARLERILRETQLHRVFAYGPPGTGKTTLPHRMAAELGWGCHSVTLTEESSGSVLIGQYVIKGGDVVWQDGVAARAMRESHERPVILVLNEVDHASGDAMTRLLEVLDDPSLCALHLPTGEVVRPKVGAWRIVATSNAEPGALLPAVADRLHLAVMVSHPHPGLVQACRHYIVQRLLAAEAREYSVRCLLSLDEMLSAGMGLREAASVVFDATVANGIVDAARLAGEDV